MATRSFLLDSDLEPAFQELVGDGSQNLFEVARRRRDFSRWLEARLLTRLQRYGDFAALKPILLGSWSRHELCPKSDIDMLFAGDEAKIHEFTSNAFKDGLKLRARTPENRADWTVGVDPFDVLALQAARAFDKEGEAELAAQQKPATKVRKTILKSIRLEREERRKRQD